MSTWVLGAATLAVGALLTTTTNLGVEAIKRRWSQNDQSEADRRSMEAERHRRAEERSEKAARELIAITGEIGELFRKYPIQWSKNMGTSGPPVDLLQLHLTKMESLLVDLLDPEARRRLELIIEAFADSEILMRFQKISSHELAWKTPEAARSCLGAMLRGDPIPQDAEFLNEYHAAVVNFYENYVSE